MACANFPRGVEFRGSLSPFFLHILKQKECIMCVQYIGGCSVHRGDTMTTWGDTMSTSGGVQYIGGIP